MPMHASTGRLFRALAAFEPAPGVLYDVPLRPDDVIELLENDGWGERHSAPHDRRRKVVRLTENAAPLVDRIEDVIVGVRGELFNETEESMVQECSALLDSLCARLQSGLKQK